MTKLVSLAIALAACDGSGARSVRLAAAVPDYGPLVGGTLIALSGANFETSNRVLIGGREAPLVRALDDRTLEVVIPPGAQPGDAEVVVIDDHGSASARGIFRYSAPPTITQVVPREVVFTSTDTTVTVAGSGFLSEGAGRVNVLVDGALASDVRVVSDSELTFTAPAGQALVRPDLEVIDARGTATFTRAFRYRPSARDGLLLFPSFTEAFAQFFDPIDNTLTPIPRVVPPQTYFTAVVRNERGDYWAIDRGRRFGMIDPRSTTIDQPRQQLSNLFPTIAGAGDRYFAIDRISRRIGEVDLETGVFTPIGTANIPCCGSYGLAFDGATLYFTSRTGTEVTITSFSTQTGELGIPVPLEAPPTFHVEEMRFFRGTLYAASRDGTFVTIDPMTGTTTALPLPVERYKAMEVFD